MVFRQSFLLKKNSKDEEKVFEEKVLDEKVFLEKVFKEKVFQRKGVLLKTPLEAKVF